MKCTIQPLYFNSFFFISSNLISCFFFPFCDMPKCVNNVKNIFHLKTPSEMWFGFVFKYSGLQDLSATDCALIDYGLLSTFYASEVALGDIKLPFSNWGCDNDIGRRVIYVSFAGPRLFVEPYPTNLS